MAYIGNTPDIDAQVLKYEYTATAGQTVFNCSYDNTVDVHINGVLLAAADYTATTGTEITLLVGATLNDEVQINGYKKFFSADHLQLAGGTMTGRAVVDSSNCVTVVDNDGSFDMNGGNNFKCTPTGAITLTFTNITNGQSGFILLVNSGQTVSAHANTKVDANTLATISVASTYLLGYFSDGTNVYITNSAAYV